MVSRFCSNMFQIIWDYIWHFFMFFPSEFSNITQKTPFSGAHQTGFVLLSRKSTREVWAFICWTWCSWREHPGTRMGLWPCPDRSNFVCLIVECLMSTSLYPYFSVFSGWRKFINQTLYKYITFNII
jgi:hypothetical protein